jgi:lipid-A-disaccharide synthase-like uncharacterized protein
VKPGPIVAMVLLIFLGMWLVLQPTLKRERYDYLVKVGSIELLVDDLGDGRVQFVEPQELKARGPMSGDEFQEVLREQWAAWLARPPMTRTLLGFFNISSWGNFAWVAVGLAGQSAFFARMFIQWIVSEKSRRSEVPELFWWFSFVGGVFLFTYFVWRADIVGVLGQSTGVVIYARNLRLIYKQKRRERREA